jgi:hypothetical protein
MVGRSTRRRWAAAAVAVGGCLLAGCSSAAAPAATPSSPSAATAPLATSLTGADGRAWAIVGMGGSASDDNLFWELFTRPAGSTQWTLVTPPGVADNGGLVVAPAAGQGLDVAFRPSQGLTFSPLALTGDGGKTWGTGVVDASVAAVPDALSLGGGKMVALLGDGAIDQSAASGATWTRLAAPGAIAASAAGRACQVTGLTAVSLTASGTPLAAASCGRPGVAGVFVASGGGWRSAGLDVGSGLAGQPIRVLRLTQFPAGNMALLQAGTGHAASLLAAWTADGTHWTVSSPLPVADGQVVASGAGPGVSGAWVLLAGRRAETVAGPGAAWRALPAPPRGTTVLAAGPAGTLDALAASGGTLTVYRLTSMTSSGAWQRTQVVSVPVQLGSSS